MSTSRKRRRSQGGCKTSGVAQLRGTVPFSPVLAGIAATRWSVLAGVLLCVAAPVVAQQGVPSSSGTAEIFDPTDLGEGPYHEMSALLEVTIFNIDVLVLTVRVGPETAARLGRLVEGVGDREYSDELADSVAAVILEADDAWARQVFKRGVGLDRLADGMRETAQKAADAGFISQSYADEFAANVPVWFGFLEEDGGKEGDAIYFRIRGDELRTAYRTADGRILMDDVAVSPEARRASIPSFFAPDTRFRKRLVESLLRGNSGQDQGSEAGAVRRPSEG